MKCVGNNKEKYIIISTISKLVILDKNYQNISLVKYNIH
jgi:hypothetical protein